MAVETRAGDAELSQILQFLKNPEIEACVAAERSFLAEVGGDCRVPAGIHASVCKGGNINAEAVIASIDGRRLYRTSGTCMAGQALHLGYSLAEQLLSEGGAAVLSELNLTKTTGGKDMKKGIVYLVGAGPGDPELLTLKGRRCLASADIVVGDYLADRHLLALASPDAEYIYVGKKAGNHAMKQEEISRLLVHLAGEGKTVVRLKGGDPLVFGRGAEEAALLAENSIPFEIVPGITSAIAAAAYAGIPVTSRGVSASFAVITGHEDPAKKILPFTGMLWPMP